MISEGCLVTRGGASGGRIYVKMNADYSRVPAAVIVVLSPR